MVSSTDIKHNTAKIHNNVDPLSTQKDELKKSSPNHTSSYLLNKNVPRKLGSNDNKDQENLEYHSSGSINVLFVAFGRIFDIVLYPDHKRIPLQRQSNYSSNQEDSTSIFYHGHLKGMQDKSEVSLTFQGMELVSFLPSELII